MENTPTTVLRKSSRAVPLVLVVDELKVKVASYLI